MKTVGLPRVVPHPHRAPAAQHPEQVLEQVQQVGAATTATALEGGDGRVAAAVARAVVVVVSRVTGHAG